MQKLKADARTLKERCGFTIEYPESAKVGLHMLLKDHQRYTDQTRQKTFIVVGDSSDTCLSVVSVKTREFLWLTLSSTFQAALRRARRTVAEKEAAGLTVDTSLRVIIAIPEFAVIIISLIHNAGLFRDMEIDTVVWWCDNENAVTWALKGFSSNLIAQEMCRMLGSLEHALGVRVHPRYISTLANITSDRITRMVDGFGNFIPRSLQTFMEDNSKLADPYVACTAVPGVERFVNWMESMAVHGAQISSPPSLASLVFESPEDALLLRRAEEAKRWQAVRNEFSWEAARRWCAQEFDACFTFVSIGSGGCLGDYGAIKAGWLEGLPLIPIYSCETFRPAQKVFSDLTGAVSLGDFKHVRTERIRTPSVLLTTTGCEEFTAMAAKRGILGGSGRDFLAVIRWGLLLGPPIIAGETSGFAESIHGGADLQFMRTLFEDNGYCFHLFKVPCLHAGDLTSRVRIFWIAKRASLPGAVERPVWPAPVFGDQFCLTLQDIMIPDDEVPPEMWIHCDIQPVNVKPPRSGRLHRVYKLADGMGQPPGNILYSPLGIAWGQTTWGGGGVVTDLGWVVEFAAWLMSDRSAPIPKVMRYRPLTLFELLVIAYLPDDYRQAVHEDLIKKFTAQGITGNTGVAFFRTILAELQRMEVEQQPRVVVPSQFDLVTDLVWRQAVDQSTMCSAGVFEAVPESDGAWGMDSISAASSSAGLKVASLGTPEVDWYDPFRGFRAIADTTSEVVEAKRAYIGRSWDLSNDVPFEVVEGVRLRIGPWEDSRVGRLGVLPIDKVRDVRLAFGNGTAPFLQADFQCYDVVLTGHEQKVCVYTGTAVALGGVCTAAELQYDTRGQAEFLLSHRLVDLPFHRAKKEARTVLANGFHGFLDFRFMNPALLGDKVLVVLQNTASEWSCLVIIGWRATWSSSVIWCLASERHATGMIMDGFTHRPASTPIVSGIRNLTLETFYQTFLPVWSECEFNFHVFLGCSAYDSWDVVLFADVQPLGIRYKDEDLCDPECTVADVEGPCGSRTSRPSNRELDMMMVRQPARDWSAPLFPRRAKLSPDVSALMLQPLSNAEWVQMHFTRAALLHAELESGTADKYARYVKEFKDFTSRYPLSPAQHNALPLLDPLLFPSALTETLLMDFVYHEAGVRGNAWSTCTGKLSGINHFQKRNGCGDVLSAKHRLHQMLRALKKLRGPKGKKHGVTRAMLFRILSLLDPVEDLDDVVIWASVLFAFHFMARSAEYCAKLDGGKFDLEKVLLACNVQFFKNGKQIFSNLLEADEVRVIFGVTKAGGGETRSVFASSSPLCVVRALARLFMKNSSLSGNTPVFSWISGSSRPGQGVRYYDVLRILKAASFSLGQSPAEFGTHSLRRGGAICYLAAGMPYEWVRMHGRWRSDSGCRAYVDLIGHETRDFVQRVVDGVWSSNVVAASGSAQMRRPLFIRDAWRLAQCRIQRAWRPHAAARRG